MPIRWPWSPRPAPPVDAEAVERERLSMVTWEAEAARLRAVLEVIDENVVAAEREEPQQ